MLSALQWTNIWRRSSGQTAFIRPGEHSAHSTNLLFVVSLNWNHPVEGCTSFSIRNNLPAPSSEKHEAKQRNQLCALSVSILTSATSVSTPAGFELKITSFDRTSVGECDRCRIEIRAVIVIFIRFRYDKKKV